MSETKTCPRCESAYDEFGACPNGHQRAMADKAAEVLPQFVVAFPQNVAAGLTNHLRASAREYLERLIKELDTA